MVNKTQFYKTKVALAVVLSLGLAACGDSEGDVANSTSQSQTDSTQNTVENQDQLTVTVKGLVIDSNGNPVVGAVVYLGSAETMTNDGGQYEFADINVTDVVGVNNEGEEDDDNTGHQSLTITVLGTDTYLGAIVEVTPEAQVNNTGGQGDEQNGGNSDTTIQTFVSGYAVEAGTAVLPMLNAGAYGYIRDCRTGQPIAETADLLSLDFNTVNEDADSVIGTQLTNSEHVVTIGADADGEFSITGLAANSSYTVSAKEGWTISDASDSELSSLTFNTNSEGSSEYLATIEVCPVDFVEVDMTVDPMFKSIAGQIGSSVVGVVDTGVILSDLTDGATPPVISAVDAKYAALNQGVVNDFVINFNEEMASTFDLSEARVKVDAGSGFATVADATVTLSADGTSATVTFVTDLAEGSKVDVWFPHWTAQDADEGEFLIDNVSVVWDSIAVEVTGSAKTTYSHVYFCTFEKPENGASVVLGPQVIDADEDQDGNSADLAAYSTAFQDNYDDNTTIITQLNDGDSASGARLVDLADARGVTVTIDQDYAVVEFDGTNAASLIWVHNTTTVVPGTTAGYTIVGTGANTELHIATSAHNDTISATPVNGFGDVITAGTMSVTLVDAIAPTTVLQESYNITDALGPRTGEDVVDGTTANAAFGNGGEVSAPGTTATAAGEPIIHIQPRHLDGAGDRNEELDALTAGMSGRLTDAEITALGGAAAAQTRMSESIIASTVAPLDDHTMPIYDATAIGSEWTAVPATIGAAFNENVTLTTTAPSFSGSTTIDGYAALNNVAADVDGNVVSVDLVTFDTPDVVALSLDAGADLGFVGSVTDSRENVSTANAQVFIQDTFPPMITATIWNGVTLELTFNEPVTIPTAGTTIRVIDPQTTTNVVAIPVAPANAAVAGNVLTVTLTGAENTAIAPLFVDGANTEFLYDDDANSSDEEQHALIDWDNIEDATGNSWSEFSPSLSTSNRGLEAAPAGADVMRWEVVAPRFLAVNAVGPFTYSVATTSYLDTGPNVADDDGTVTYTLTFTHPIDLNASNAFSDVVAAHPSYTLPITTAVSASTADANGTTMIDDLFQIDLNNDGADAFVVATTPVSATEVHGAFTISADHKVLTLTVTGVADTPTESIGFTVTTIGLKTTTDSAITGTQTSAGDFVWQNNN